MPILVLMAARGGNIPIKFLIDDNRFSATVVVADYLDPGAALPPHRLIFNTIGDADWASEGLEAAARFVNRSTAPVINPPQRVIGTGRAEIAQRLAGIEGLRVPRLITLPRATVTPKVLAEHGLGFPLLIRPPGFHTGRHFVRVERTEDLDIVLEILPGETMAAIEAVDARDRDGLWRKYRVMTIDGRLYPLHMAASKQWKVHYFTAAMADHPELRAEEERFLQDMPGVLGPRGVAALAEVQVRLGLEYGGIDFGLDESGNLILFEANATMVINPPDADPRWDYRRAPIQRALDAFRVMLAARAGNVAGSPSE